MDFWKYHGLGNDFILVDMRGRGEISPDMTRRICARRTGVGADGILGLYEDHGYRMRVFNSDGSIADMCGNGLRCFVAWLIHEHHVPIAPISIHTDAGPQRCTPRIIGAQGQVGVTVDLGPATFESDVRVEVADKFYTGTPMTIGNPHFVIPRKVEEGEAEQYGYGLSTHAAFKDGVNVEWLHVCSSTEADLVVFERGAGLTLACGTGGGGAAATGVRQGLLAPDTELTINLPGGALQYVVASDFSSVLMTGPTERVYRASLPFAL